MDETKNMASHLIMFAEERGFHKFCIGDREFDGVDLEQLENELENEGYSITAISGDVWIMEKN